MSFLNEILTAKNIDVFPRVRKKVRLKIRSFNPTYARRHSSSILFILGTEYSRDIFSIDPLYLNVLLRWLNTYKVCKIFRKTFKARQNATFNGGEGVGGFPVGIHSTILL